MDFLRRYWWTIILGAVLFKATMIWMVGVAFMTYGISWRTAVGVVMVVAINGVVEIFMRGLQKDVERQNRNQTTD